MPNGTPSNLEEIITAVYCALDDALAEANVPCRDGKLIWRRGPPPEMDDREVLCLAVLQELLGYESDNAFFLWLAKNVTVQELFPKLLTRQKFAERRALLVPLMQKLCQAFCTLGGEAAPPFTSSTPIRSRFVNSCGGKPQCVSMGWLRPAIVPR